MRNEARNQARLERGKGRIPRPEDFGFYYPLETVRNWALHLERHGHLPDAGGIDDQDARKMADIYTWQSIMAWARQEANDLDEDM